MGALTDDPALREMTFVVIDFEGTTPTRRPPQPIEVAALALTYGATGGWEQVWAYESLMKPPPFAPLTTADTHQTGITAAMLADAPSAADAMAALDAHLAQGPYLLVAHHASIEGNMIYHRQEDCPVLAATDLLDTIPLAKHLLPELENYQLDTLLRHYGVTRPLDRHRAMADVRVTADVFGCLINEADSAERLRTLRALTTVARRRAKANEPVQQDLF
ncbi:PolC-type DNA polymerase III [Streptomyces sp. H34-S4]|uniref:3'-5' exonuclease n=1 Tax=Streptomyces sp. H34-S4 TaxID=2996463 RepID=UPI00226D87DB|nr:3'-5' exonuclease [Streptomyces sp. H34-S4]MCY0935972.1 3'-5' exonuclease [Streptomyces sp. H34-S4]